MSLYIDQKYVSLLSVKLDQFKHKKNYLWNFRCPICNDSKKSKIKARAYIYRQKSNLSFSCHNCGHSCSFSNFLKTLDHTLFQEYQMERYKNESTRNVKEPDFTLVKTKPIFNKSLSIPTIESLSDSHTAKKYVKNRLISPEFWNVLYYADDFKKFIQNTFIDYNINRLIDNDTRLVIPFYDRDNNLLGVQGRALDQSKIRYITIKKEEAKKIYGLNRIDLTKQIYVVEGPIDSLFLNNAVATMDANLTSVSDILPSNIVLVFDNEKRNKEIVNNMERAIKRNFQVCIWPDSIEQKDINDMIKSGLTIQNIHDIIQKNTFVDLKAQLQFNLWRKV